MIGDLDEDGGGVGLLPRAMRYCFDRATSQSLLLSVQIQMMEIYNEEIRDLLCLPGTPSKIQIRHDAQFGTAVEGLTLISPLDYSEAMEHVREGLERRSTSETRMNKSSSRSHVLCYLVLSDLVSGKGSLLPKSVQSLPSPHCSELTPLALSKSSASSDWQTSRAARGRQRLELRAASSGRAGRSTRACRPWRGWSTRSRPTRGRRGPLPRLRPATSTTETPSSRESFSPSSAAGGTLSSYSAPRPSRETPRRPSTP